MDPDTFAKTIWTYGKNGYARLLVGIVLALAAHYGVKTIAPADVQAWATATVDMTSPFFLWAISAGFGAFEKKYLHNELPPKDVVDVHINPVTGDVTTTAVQTVPGATK